MNQRILKIIMAVLVLMAVSLACEFSASTAKINSATMALDNEGTQPTTTFAPSDTFYCIVDLQNAPDDTVVKAAWTAVDVADTEANTAIDETELTSGSGTLHFELANDNAWPAGTYKVDLYINDKLAQTVEFNVQ